MPFSKLIKIEQLSGTIELVTGLHIGSGNTEMHIGGSDSPVIRNPITNEPYIPGSSLKGKIRSLLEWHAGLAAINDGKPMSYDRLDQAHDRTQALNILKLFGLSGSNNQGDAAEEVGPTRLAFRDCPLDPEWVKKIRDKNRSLTETKMENTIDRVRGTAKDPRNIERVVAGALFRFEVAIKVLDGDRENLIQTLLIGINLLQMDSLGGSGSRGYGRVRFNLTEKWQQQLKDAKPW
ncbi:MAG: type III-A CRISPR-associated RAMP protein Csm3 [Magnetococcales bacterium]|nr:type III-A CRISPR-associated RAMP protein Csm3 [Magnetococcales bacterium]